MQTEKAILLVGETLKNLQIHAAYWYLDQPVSNSGRLKTKLLEVSNIHGFNWSVDLVFSPDKVLAKSKHIVVTSDGWILNQVNQWFNLGEFILNKHIPDASIIEV